MSTFLRITLAVMALLMVGVAVRAAAHVVDPGQEFGLSVPALPSATPATVPARAYGCPSGPCPTSLEFGVNGCT